MNIRFELTETLFVISCILFLNGVANVGWTFFTLAALNGVVRFSLNQAEKLEDNKKKAKLEEDIKSLMADQQNLVTGGQVYPKIVH